MRVEWGVFIHGCCGTKDDSLSSLVVLDRVSEAPPTGAQQGREPATGTTGSLKRAGKSGAGKQGKAACTLWHRLAGMGSVSVLALMLGIVPPVCFLRPGRQRLCQPAWPGGKAEEGRW